MQRLLQKYPASKSTAYHKKGDFDQLVSTPSAPLQYKVTYHHKNKVTAKLLTIVILEYVNSLKEVELTFSSSDLLVAFFKSCPEAWQKLERAADDLKQVDLDIDRSTLKSGHFWMAIDDQTSSREPCLSVCVASKGMLELDETHRFTMSLQHVDNKHLFKALLFAMRRFEAIDMRTLIELSSAMGVANLITPDDVLACLQENTDEKTATAEAERLDELSLGTVFGQINRDHVLALARDNKFDAARYLAKVSLQKDFLFCELGHYYLSQANASLANICFNEASLCDPQSPWLSEARLRLNLATITEKSLSDAIPELMFVDAVSSHKPDKALIAKQFHDLCGFAKETPVIDGVFDGDLQTYLQLARRVRALSQSPSLQTKVSEKGMFGQPIESAITTSMHSPRKSQ